MKRAAAHAVHLGLIQSACAAHPEANFKKTFALAERAARQGAQIICTQELFRSQYFCQREDHKNFVLAETIPGPSTGAFSKLAKKYKVVVIASLFEKRAAGVYHNTAAVIDADGSLLGIYRKMHIPDDPLFYEKFYFTPGDTGFRAWQTRRAKIGVLICWDQWYPEAARLTALQGAQILFYARRFGIQNVADEIRKDWRADLLGSVVSGSGAPDCNARRRNPVLSDRHRLASAREKETRREPA